MKPIHRLGHILFYKNVCTAYRFIDGVIDQLLFRGWRLTQNESRDFIFITRVADANTQSIEVRVIAQLVSNVFQPVMTTVTAAELELGYARGRSSSS